MFVYNTIVHLTTNHQPYELVYGFPAVIPHTLSGSPQARYNYDDYTFELNQKLQEAHKMDTETIISCKQRSKHVYDKKQHQINVKVDDQLWIKNRQQKGKLGQKWLGLV